MGTRLLRGMLVAATTGIGVTMLTPMAAQAAVSCGQTITTSMTLTADLVCPGNGILVNASNVVLDLGGHTLTGPAPSGAGTRGVGVGTDRHAVTVRNGTIRGFDRGVILFARADASITGLTLDGNGSGIQTQTDSSGSRITGNTIINTTQFSGIQLGGNGHVVEANAFDNGASAGIFLSGNDNVIRSNRINDAGASGIAIGAFPSNPGPFVNNRISSNEINGAGRLFNSSAISVSNGSGTVVENNLVNGRRGTAPGISVNNSSGTVVATNSVSNAGTGILVQGTSTGTQVTGNRAAQNVFSGINVQNTATGTLLSANNATANGGNGISVSSPSTTITGNTAVQNAALGIFAVSGVVDGGGNRAFGNGNPAQCSPNIAC